MGRLTLPLESHQLPQLPSVVTNHSQDKPLHGQGSLPEHTRPEQTQQCLSTSDQVLCHCTAHCDKGHRRWWDSAKKSHAHLPKVTSSCGKAHCPHPQHSGYNPQHLFASACYTGIASNVLEAWEKRSINF